jgi:hypothetical protein
MAQPPIPLRSLVLRWYPTAAFSRACAICTTGPVEAPAGPVLCVEGTGALVCRDCGQRQAPGLAALVAFTTVLHEVTQATPEPDELGAGVIVGAALMYAELAQAAQEPERDN